MPKDKRQSSKVDRRALLINAAARQFVKVGFASATIRDIAADAGIQGGSVYYHFASKDELMMAVYEMGMDRITKATIEASKGIDDPWERLESACVAHLTALLHGGVIFRSLMLETPREWLKKRRHITAMRDRYEQIFAHLIDELPLATGTDRRALRLMLIGALNWSYTWYRHGGSEPRHIARKFVEFLKAPLACSRSQIK